MNMIKIAPIALAMFLVTTLLTGCIIVVPALPKSRVSGNQFIRLGNTALADGRYDVAISNFKEAMRRGKLRYLPALIQAAKARRDLKKLRNPVLHRVAVIFITKRNISRQDGSVETVVDVTEKQKQQSYWIARWLTHVTEGMSRGNLTLTFDFVDAVSSYRHDHQLKPEHRNYMDRERFFLENMHRYDTFVTVANTISPALGGGKPYPYINGVINGPWRGYMSVNARPHHGPELWFHEFFHVIERFAGFRRNTHGWRKDGSDEFDFYQRHFDKDIPRHGWRRLALTKRFPVIPVTPLGIANHEKVQRAYRGIPLASRRRAGGLITRAKREKHRAKKQKLLRVALKLSPYQETDLRKLLLLSGSGRAAASRVYRERLATVLSFSQRPGFRTKHRPKGSILGTWNLTQMSTSGSEIEWDASDYFLRHGRPHGPYKVSFLYSGGRKGINIQWAALYADGKEVFRDAHPGWSGSKPRNHIYTLNLPKLRVGARYTIRARVASVGGINSNGVVMIDRVRKPN